MSAADEVLDSARSVEGAIRRLCRAALTRSNMAPAEVDIALAQLTAAVGALPQVVSQLGDILARADRHYRLEMDNLVETQHPGVAIDTARNHLDAARELAFDLYRHLDAAHNQTAHIATRPVPADTTEENRPTLGSSPQGPSPTNSRCADPFPASRGDTQTSPAEAPAPRARPAPHHQRLDSTRVRVPAVVFGFDRACGIHHHRQRREDQLARRGEVRNRAKNETLMP